MESTAKLFIVWTDHKNLAYFNPQGDLTPGKQGGLCFLYDSTFQSLTGQGPATSNRMPCSDSFPPLRTRRTLRPSSRPPAWWELSPGRLSQPFERLKEWNRIQEPARQLFVSQSDRSQVLQWAHTTCFSCHPGIHRTITFLQCYFWWPTQSRDAQEALFVALPKLLTALETARLLTNHIFRLHASLMTSCPTGVPNLHPVCGKSSAPLWALRSVCLWISSSEQRPIRTSKPGVGGGPALCRLFQPGHLE